MEKTQNICSICECFHLNQCSNTVLTGNTWGLEAVFPLKKMLAAVALNPYQARGGFCALQFQPIKCLPGGLGWHSSVGLWAHRAHEASAASLASLAPFCKEQGTERARGEQGTATPPLSSFQELPPRLGHQRAPGTAKGSCARRAGQAPCGCSRRKLPAHICHELCLQARQQMLAGRVAELWHPT